MQHTATNQRFAPVSIVDFGIDHAVTEARDSCFDEHLVCILEVSREKWVDKWLKNNLSVRCLLFHPHVLKIYDVFLSGEDICVIFEHPNGANLLEFLKRYEATERFVRNLFQQLIFALEYYHQKGIDGLDLALERLFYNFDCGVLKIVDFGFCDQNVDEEQTFSLPYVAPEQIGQSSHDRIDNKAVDVWRCGVLLYCMLFRAFPFCPREGTTQPMHIMNILKARWSVPEGDCVTKECRDLLHRMLAKDPDARIKLSEIKQHPWYQRDLPDGVLQYKCLSRPNDGLPTKLEAIRSVCSSGLRHVAAESSCLGV